MTSGCWFSGKRWPSRKFMACPCGERGSEGRVALDAGAFHLSMAGRVIHDGVVLRRAVVPEGDRVRLPADAHLVLGKESLRHEVTQQVARAVRVVLAVAHVGRRMEVG